MYCHSLVRIVLASVLASVACAGAPACEELEHSSLPQLVEHLKGARSTSAPRVDCIVFAINTLAENPFVPAADILSSYLDFKVPKPPQAFVVVHQLSFMEEYPAALALAEIGLPAAGSLVRALANTESSNVLRENAEDVLLTIFKGDPAAVGLVRQASKTAPDAATAGLLFESASRMARKCFPDWRAACEVALQ
jgi:hypothetical protein